MVSYCSEISSAFPYEILHYDWSHRPQLPITAAAVATTKIKTTTWEELHCFIIDMLKVAGRTSEHL